MSVSPGKVPNPAGVYPLNGEDPNPGKEPVFPDFRVWKHSSKDDMTMKANLQKGFFEPAVVASESHSGRQIFTQLLSRTTPEVADASTKIKMANLSDVMVKALVKRRDINKIKSKSTYRPPPRVTLTDHKRELWMNNLANPNIPLKQLARAIPHGLRNRFLLEQCMAHQVPIARTIWLVRCVSANEQRQLKRKLSNAAGLNKWVVEWTEQVVQFLEQVISSSFAPQNRDSWKSRLNFILELSSNLYVEDLLSRETFLGWITSYLDNLLKSESLNLIAVHYQFVRLFWFKMISVDYLSKDLGEKLLLAVSKVQHPKLLRDFQLLVQYLFYYNSDAFIIPNSWSSLKSSLKALIDLSYPPISEQYKLILYRNESLMIDEATNEAYTNFGSRKAIRAIQKLDNVHSLSLKNLCKEVFEDTSDSDCGSVDDWQTTIALILKWSITTSRDSAWARRISAVCSLLRIKIQQLGQVKSKKNRQFKLELEMAIIDFAYSMADELDYLNPDSNPYSFTQFLLLINELHSMGLFVLSSYLRRLIASGVIYLQKADNSCYVHLLILDSLSIQDSNAKNILKRLVDSTGIVLRNKDDPELQEKLSIPNIYDLDEIWPCSETSPLDVGVRIKNYGWLYSKLKQQKDWVASFDSLYCYYRIFEERLQKVPEFLSLVVEHVESYTEIEPRVIWLLLKLVSYNDELLACCYDNEITVYQKLYSTITSWYETNRFNITQVLWDVRFNPQLSPTLRETEFTLETLHLEHLGLIGVSSAERLVNAAEFSHSLGQAINQYWSLVNSMSYSDSQMSPIYRLMKGLQAWKREQFQNVLVLHLKKFSLPSLALDYEASLKFILKLVLDNFIDIHAIVKLFEDASKDEFSSQSGERLIWDLHFCEEFELSNYDLFLLNFQRKVYRNEHSVLFYNQLHRVVTTTTIATPRPLPVVAPSHLVDTGVSVDDLNPLSDLAVVPVAQTPPVSAESAAGLVRPSAKPRKLNSLIEDGIWRLVSSNRPLFVKLFYETHGDATQFQNLLLVVLKNLPVGASNDEAIVLSLVKRLNYFNLPLEQLLFKSLLEELQLDDDKLKTLLRNILQELDAANDESVLVSDLFEHLDDTLKLRLLNCCEELYLRSEQFPRFLVNGQNYANFLMDMASSCSRLQESKTITLSDSLVFSLNLSLEKLMYYCSNVDAKRNADDLEKAVMFVSRIILIHKSFLVDLILKRSVNLQRDVFLVNLTKLFHHSVMDKNSRLKNLLYDTLISIKIQISETTATAPQASVPTPQPPFITSLSLNKGTPTSTTNSPLPSSAPHAERSVYTMNVSPPSYNNKLKFLLADARFAHLKDTLVEEERKYYLVDRSSETLVRFNVRRFELIQDASSVGGVNDSCINLQYFNTSFDRKNPP
ncbi:hypothetical protein OGAPHI_003393 [Ogataea philodendri]|uniref:Mediator of RNA polymerase II transcription subunit 12 n=1 Tax=Ogataea philodendri TaxID=1378263 RepID=A0A9P8P7E8_9ASCO|nr:uncharacterized protein OGAPHI_003393 [Ogataea philodendri]KAH3666943.1 hypothetical protein OGAPHI_003393 [Ogataea philodendri]